MMRDTLVCSDLDRTILPNGPQPESPAARPLLRRLAGQTGFHLVYVSGRSRDLLQRAIDEYDLPLPAFAIGDVGTTIFDPHRDWTPWADWAAEIARDWRGLRRQELEPLFADLPAIRLQEPEKQNTYKLSYYAAVDTDISGLREEMGRRLAGAELRASLIWSVDEEKEIGLLDVLPERATKVHAIRFLMEKRGFTEQRTVFAGDSGNDLPALTSGLQAVLVKNAADDVRRQARADLAARGLQGRLYEARGGFLGMNGNYCAGVLEGVAHYLPETRALMMPLR